MPQKSLRGVLTASAWTLIVYECISILMTILLPRVWSSMSPDGFGALCLFFTSSVSVLNAVLYILLLVLGLMVIRRDKDNKMAYCGGILLVAQSALRLLYAAFCMIANWVQISVSVSFSTSFISIMNVLVALALLLIALKDKYQPLIVLAALFLVFEILLGIFNSTHAILAQGYSITHTLITGILALIAFILEVCYLFTWAKRE